MIWTNRVKKKLHICHVTSTWLVLLCVCIVRQIGLERADRCQRRICSPFRYWAYLHIPDCSFFSWKRKCPRLCEIYRSIKPIWHSFWVTEAQSSLRMSCAFHPGFTLSISAEICDISLPSLGFDKIRYRSNFSYLSCFYTDGSNSSARWSHTYNILFLFLSMNK